MTELRDEDLLEGFVELSVVLTGHTAFRLRGTGLAEEYLRTARRAAGHAVVDDLVDVFRSIVDRTGEDTAGRDRLVRREVLGDPRLGPIARNLIKMWYVGTWYRLPAGWLDAFGSSPYDTTVVVRPDAYVEGLLWPSIGANPPGAKAPGYGTWAAPVRIPST